MAAPAGRTYRPDQVGLVFDAAPYVLQAGEGVMDAETVVATTALVMTHIAWQRNVVISSDDPDMHVDAPNLDLAVKALSSVSVKRRELRGSIADSKSASALVKKGAARKVGGSHDLLILPFMGNDVVTTLTSLSSIIEDAQANSSRHIPSTFSLSSSSDLGRASSTSSTSTTSSSSQPHHASDIARLAEQGFPTLVDTMTASLTDFGWLSDMTAPSSMIRAPSALLNLGAGKTPSLPFALPLPALDSSTAATLTTALAVGGAAGGATSAASLNPLVSAVDRRAQLARAALKHSLLASLASADHNSPGWFPLALAVPSSSYLLIASSCALFPSASSSSSSSSSASSSSASSSSASSALAPFASRLKAIASRCATLGMGLLWLDTTAAAAGVATATAAGDGDNCNSSTIGEGSDGDGDGGDDGYSSDETKSAPPLFRELVLNGTSIHIQPKPLQAASADSSTSASSSSSSSSVSIPVISLAALARIAFNVPASSSATSTATSFLMAASKPSSSSSMGASVSSISLLSSSSSSSSFASNHPSTDAAAPYPLPRPFPLYFHPRFYTSHPSHASQSLKSLAATIGLTSDSSTHYAPSSLSSSSSSSSSSRSSSSATALTSVSAPSSTSASLGEYSHLFDNESLSLRARLIARAAALKEQEAQRRRSSSLLEASRVVAGGTAALMNQQSPPPKPSAPTLNKTVTTPSASPSSSSSSSSSTSSRRGTPTRASQQNPRASPSALLTASSSLALASTSPISLAKALAMSAATSSSLLLSSSPAKQKVANANLRPASARRGLSLFPADEPAAAAAAAAAAAVARPTSSPLANATNLGIGGGSSGSKFAEETKSATGAAVQQTSQPVQLSQPYVFDALQSAYRVFVDTGRIEAPAPRETLADLWKAYGGQLPPHFAPAHALTGFGVNDDGATDSEDDTASALMLSGSVLDISAESAVCAAVAAVTRVTSTEAALVFGKDSLTTGLSLAASSSSSSSLRSVKDKKAASSSLTARGLKHPSTAGGNGTDLGIGADATTAFKSSYQLWNAQPLQFLHNAVGRALLQLLFVHLLEMTKFSSTSSTTSASSASSASSAKMIATARQKASAALAKFIRSSMLLSSDDVALLGDDIKMVRECCLQVHLGIIFGATNCIGLLHSIINTQNSALTTTSTSTSTAAPVTDPLPNSRMKTLLAAIAMALLWDNPIHAARSFQSPVKLPLSGHSQPMNDAHDVLTRSRLTAAAVSSATSRPLSALATSSTAASAASSKVPPDPIPAPSAPAGPVTTAAQILYSLVPLYASRLPLTLKAIAASISSDIPMQYLLDASTSSRPPPPPPLPPPSSSLAAPASSTAIGVRRSPRKAAHGPTAATTLSSSTSSSTSEATGKSLLGKRARSPVKASGAPVAALAASVLSSAVAAAGSDDQQAEANSGRRLFDTRMHLQEAQPQQQQQRQRLQLPNRDREEDANDDSNDAGDNGINGSDIVLRPVKRARGEATLSSKLSASSATPGTALFTMDTTTSSSSSSFSTPSSSSSSSSSAVATTPADHDGSFSTSSVDVTPSGPASHRSNRARRQPAPSPISLLQSTASSAESTSSSSSSAVPAAPASATRSRRGKTTTSSKEPTSVFTPGDLATSSTSPGILSPPVRTRRAAAGGLEAGAGAQRYVRGAADPLAGAGDSDLYALQDSSTSRSIGPLSLGVTTPLSEAKVGVIAAVPAMARLATRGIRNDDPFNLENGDVDEGDGNITMNPNTRASRKDSRLQPPVESDNGGFSAGSGAGSSSGAEGGRGAKNAALTRRTRALSGVDNDDVHTPTELIHGGKPSQHPKQQQQQQQHSRGFAQDDPASTRANHPVSSAAPLNALALSSSMLDPSITDESNLIVVPLPLPILPSPPALRPHRSSNSIFAPPVAADPALLQQHQQLQLQQQQQQQHGGESHSHHRSRSSKGSGGKSGSHHRLKTMSSTRTSSSAASTSSTLSASSTSSSSSHSKSKTSSKPPLQANPVSVPAARLSHFSQPLSKPGRLFSTVKMATKPTLSAEPTKAKKTGAISAVPLYSSSAQLPPRPSSATASGSSAVSSTEPLSMASSLSSSNPVNNVTINNSNNPGIDEPLPWPAPSIEAFTSASASASSSSASTRRSSARSPRAAHVPAPAPTAPAPVETQPSSSPTKRRQVPLAAPTPTRPSTAPASSSASVSHPVPSPLLPSSTSAVHGSPDRVARGSSARLRHHHHHEAMMDAEDMTALLGLSPSILRSPHVFTSSNSAQGTAVAASSATTASASTGASSSSGAGKGGARGHAGSALVPPSPSTDQTSPYHSSPRKGRRPGRLLPPMFPSPSKASSSEGNSSSSSSGTSAAAASNAAGKRGSGSGNDGASSNQVSLSLAEALISSERAVGIPVPTFPVPSATHGTTSVPASVSAPPSGSASLVSTIASPPRRRGAGGNRGSGASASTIAADGGTLLSEHLAVAATPTLSASSGVTMSDASSMLAHGAGDERKTRSREDQQHRQQEHHTIFVGATPVKKVSASPSRSPRASRPRSMTASALFSITHTPSREAAAQHL